MNQIQFSGHLVKDPVLTETEGGMLICKFTIAINDSSGEDTEYPRIEVIGNTLAQICQNNLRKGKFCAVAARYKTVKYQKEGETKKYEYFIVNPKKGGTVNF